MNEYHLQNKLELITSIGDTAGKEFQLESALKKMMNAWTDVNLEVIEYKGTGSHILRAMDEAIAMLDEQIVTTQVLIRLNFSAYLYFYFTCRP